MKALCVLVLLSCFILSCKSYQTLAPETTALKKISGYVPVDPLEYAHPIQLFQKQQSLRKHLGQCSKQEKLDFLINENVLVSVLEHDRGGDLSVSNSFVSKKNSSYRVIMDYSKFRTVNSEECGQARIGVGLRLVAHIKAHKSNINFGDLFALGLAAESNHISGTLSIEIIGIKSKEVTGTLPLPSEINRTSIQQAMQALSTIKSRIYDQTTQIHPQVIAIKTCSEDPAQYDNLIGELGKRNDKNQQWEWRY